MSERITQAELNRIAKRHKDIPQDGLFDLPATGGGTKPKVKRPRSLAFAPCPECHAPGNRLTGLIAKAQDVLMFRDHTRRVGRVSLPCSGSGVVWEGDRYDVPNPAAF